MESAAATTRRAGEFRTLEVWPFIRRHAFAPVAVVLVFVCAAFTAVASGTVLIVTVMEHGLAQPEHVGKLVVRVLLFAGMAALAFQWLRMIRPVTVITPAGALVPSRKIWWPVIFPLVAAAIMAFPRLGASPHVEPDEWHHLTVARNLAMHGLYASGDAHAGYVYFDDYDSVGPPVIVPVAAAMRVSGAGIEPARFVMAIFYIGLAATVYAFCLAPFGPWAAALSSILVTGAWGSAYLGRTLYGEVPALMFLLLALMAWQSAIRSPRVWTWGITAGLLFGCAVLSKNFALMAVWAFLGAVVLDRFQGKQIGLRHVAAPGFGAAVVIGAWSGVQFFAQHNVSEAATGQLGMYQHNLLFGFEGLPATVGLLVDNLLSAVAVLAAIAFGIHLVTMRHNEPALTALIIFAGFQWYWWLFFNTGNLPRYSWYGWTTAALFAGPLVWALVRNIHSSERGMWQRAAAAGCVVALLAPVAARGYFEGRRAVRDDEMAPTRALAAFVAGLPQESRVATVFWPLERSIPFLSGRAVARVGPNQAASLIAYDIVLVYQPNHPAWLEGAEQARFGPYAAVSPHHLVTAE